MANMWVNDTLGTESNLVFAAVSVHHLLRMLLTMNDPWHWSSTSWSQGLVEQDELVLRSGLWFEMLFLASGTEGHGAVFAVFNGGVFFADLADHIVWISKTPTHRRRSSRCSSEYSGGKAIDRQRVWRGVGCFQFKGRSTHRTSQRSLNYYNSNSKFKFNSQKW